MIGKYHAVRRHMIGALFAAFLVVAPGAFGSGSIGGGAGGVNQYGQIYQQGKMVFFGQLACSRAACPIKRNQVNASLAATLVASIRGASGIRLETSQHDAAVDALTPDEREKVRYYLSRRFGIKS